MSRSRWLVGNSLSRFALIWYHREVYAAARRTGRGFCVFSVRRRVIIIGRLGLWL
jgi:hypothetical protein